MTTTTKPAPPASASGPAIRDLPDDMFDAIASARRGRTSTPSVYLDAVKSLPVVSHEVDEAKYGWKMVKATAENTVKDITRELRKAGAQLNAELAEVKSGVVEPVRVLIRSRDDHPKHGPFVAFAVTTVPPKKDPVTTVANAPATGA